jgi:hypothetical protein
MTESDQKNLKGFIYFLITCVLLMFFVVVYVHVISPYGGINGPCNRGYQPELSWYSGPIGNPCGCR